MVAVRKGGRRSRTVREKACGGAVWQCVPLRKEVVIKAIMFEPQHIPRLGVRLGQGGIGLRGGSFEPLSRTPSPPFWAPVTGTPDGLTGEVGGGGGGGVSRYHNRYDSK